MKLLHKFILVSMLAFLPTYLFAGTILEAERSVGKIRLGMSEKEFLKDTGIKPRYCPGESDKKETCAVVKCENIPSICGDFPEVTEMSVGFWKKKIYLIMAGIREIPLETTKIKLSSKYGPPHETLNQGTPGRYVVMWKSKKTEISATYSSKDHNVFVFQVKDLLQNTEGAAF